MRAEIKERLFILYEQAKKNEEAVDTADFRRELETVAENSYLLTEEERLRLYSELAEIGFGVDRISRDMYRIQRGEWGMISGPSIYYY